MVVGFIQYLIYHSQYDNMNKNYGKILIEFLKHYGAYFDYTNYKIVPSLPTELIIDPYPQVRS